MALGRKMGMLSVSVILPYTRGQHGPVASAAGGSGPEAWTSPTPRVGLVGGHTVLRERTVSCGRPRSKSGHYREKKPSVRLT